MKENWKPIEKFKDYEVSDLGRVRRVSGGHGAVAGKVLKPSSNGNAGYSHVVLSNNEKKRYNKRIHVLVARAFIPNPLGLPEVNHKGPKEDNRAIQLEWQNKKGHAIDIMRRNQIGLGVCFVTSKNKWKAYYGENHHVGYFDTKKEALIARKDAISALENK
jgi:hypothetical protein